MFQEAKKSGVLLLLPEYPAPAGLRPMWQNEVHVKDRGLCDKTCWCLHHRNGHGGKDLNKTPPEMWLELNSSFKEAGGNLHKLLLFK